jgi:tetratricopeptide (TPR) repeat protein
MRFKKSEILKTSILALVVGALLWIPTEGFPQSSGFKNFNWGAWKGGGMRGFSRYRSMRGFNRFDNRNKIQDLSADLDDILDANATLEPFARLKGMVWGEDGKPAANIEITIERQDSKGSFKTKSNAKGEYSYSGLAAGEYVLGVIYKGDAGLLREAVLRNGRTLESIFDLKDWSPMGKAGFDKDKLLTQNDGEPGLDGKITLEDQEKFDKAKDLMAAGDYQGALLILKQLTEKYPKEAVFWGRLGEALLMLRKYDESVVAYRTAVELKPDITNYNGQLAMALLFAGKIDEAIVYTEKTASLDPVRGAQAYYNLGLALTDKGDGQKAEAAFEKSTKLDGNFAESYYQLGLTFLTTHTIPPLKITDAIEPLEKYRSLSKGSEEKEVQQNVSTAALLIAEISKPPANAPKATTPAPAANGKAAPAPATTPKAPAASTGGKK